MFNSILKEHRAKSQHTRKQLDQLKNEALQAAEQVTHHLYHEVQTGVGLIYKNQRLLQNEASTLQAHTQRFQKQSERWMQLSSQLNTSLKELGDVHNWALTIQKDMRWIETNLQEVIESNNTRKIAIKEKRETELARRRAEKEEQERIEQEEKERKAAKRAAARQPNYPSATIDPSATSAAAVDAVDGEDEELP